MREGRPSDDPLVRKLSAVLYADVVDYSRLTGKDEEGTHRRLSEYLDLLSDHIEDHHGRVVHYAGDAVLAEFDTVVDAVSCGVDIQNDLHARNEALPEDQRVWFRIGVNLGDVIVDRHDIYGDGVNIAARLEGLADPGGICLSGTVHDALGNRLELGYAYMGEQQVKNIAQPVRTYRVIFDWTEPARDPVFGAAVRSARRKLALFGSVIVMMTAAAVAWWLLAPVPDEKPSPTTGVAAAPDPTAGATTPTADQPEQKSIAVLPFINMSNDPEQEYFSDGLTEDLITDLSRISGLFVIARNSTFVYKGQTVNVQDVGRELGVRYILEGSVRKAANRIRINAQLIDVENGMHIWADRFDRELTDVFALQDEVTRTIVDALAVNLTEEDEARLRGSDATTPEAYDTLLRGNELFSRYTPEDNANAREWYREAISLDPGYARAHANLALTHGVDVLFGWTTDREQSIRLGIAAAEEARRIDDSVPQIHFTLANLHGAEVRWDLAYQSALRSIELEPSYSDGYGMLAVTLTFLSRLDEAMAAVEKSKQLNPRYSYIILWLEGRILFLMGRFEEAAARLEEAVDRNPAFDQSRILLAAVYGNMGRHEDAEWQAEEVLAMHPEFTISEFMQRWGYRTPEHRQLLVEGLRVAGIPE